MNTHEFKRNNPDYVTITEAVKRTGLCYESIRRLIDKKVISNKMMQAVWQRHYLIPVNELSIIKKHKESLNG